MANLDNVLWLAELLAETAVIGMLIYRRAWKNFPFFCAYCTWDVASSAAMFLILARYSNSYSLAYFLQTTVSSVLEFCVLVEIGWSVLRPMRNVLPRFTPYVIALLILIVGAAIWPFDALQSFSAYPLALRGMMHVQQTTSILRVVVFLALAGGSQFLSIGWRDRELQVATGLGFYSLVGLGAAMMQARQTTFDQYTHAHQVVLACFIASCLYWVYSFAQKEAERREFTPQMQSMLLAVAGVARTNRTALSDPSITETQRRRNR